jgi:hypothetical protein
MADKPKSLTQFRVQETDDVFTLHIEDDAGETMEFGVTREQLDVIVEHLDDLLSADDADV